MASLPDYPMTFPDEWLPRPKKPDQAYGLLEVTTIRNIRIDKLSFVLHSWTEFDTESLIEIETLRPTKTRPLSPETRIWVQASVFVAKWLRRHISAALMTQLRMFALPMSLADELIALIWAYMDFNQVSVDFERFNRYENQKLSDYPYASQYVEAFGQSYLRLQRRSIAPVPYHAVLRLLHQLGQQHPALKDGAIREMERERMCASVFTVGQLWRTARFLIQQLRIEEAAASHSD
ncbi:hypothetical protein N7490_008337 [Penicillium lividum]|nr:hypothetical protein N7490_008337 [Penicillium lividum]